MSNVEFIKRIYAAFAMGDVGAVLGAFDPAIVWNEAENSHLADLNPYTSPGAVASGVFGRILAEFDGFAATPASYVDGGGTVVALGRYTGTFKATGAKLDVQFAHVWTIASGKAVRFQQYTDTLGWSRVRGG